GHSSTSPRGGMCRRAKRLSHMRIPGNCRVMVFMSSILTFLEEVDEHFQLGGEIRPAWVVEKVTPNLWAVLVEHAREPLLGHVLPHHSLEHVRQPKPIDGGVDEHGSIIGDDVSRDGDLEVLAV